MGVFNLYYDSIKRIIVINKIFGGLNKFFQLAIIVYIIGYKVLWEKGNQALSDIESEVTTKVKGVVYTNFSDDEYMKGVDPSLYNRVWDETYYVVPPLTTVISESDLAVLYCVRKRQLYKTKKYVEVETEYDGFQDTSVREEDPPADFSYQRQP